ncbi:hypothetical protein RJT34_21635 [Clitoria ternatea]|uniref:Spermidine hydroxycinnamoyl transferase n=1 Tax=Clitoria ternatea TaxID=43366 RepID=A0AAN9IUT4_CLITE
MVTIHRSHLVTPSETTQSTTLSLSHCDQIKLPNHSSQLYIYTNTPPITNHSSLHTLSTSLSRTLTHYFPLAGRLTKTPRGQLQLLCNAKGALLLEATCDHHLNFHSSGDIVSSNVLEQLVPKIDYQVPLEDIPLFVAQVTRFPCGSLTLGFALCRALADGTAGTSSLNTWAKLARGKTFDSSSLMPPLLDRALLDSRKLNKPPRFEHPEFFPPPLLRSGVAQHTSVPPQLATTILKLTKGQVGILKKKASEFGNELGPHRPYSSFEVISGHLWRCACKVRYVGTNGVQPTRLTTLVNCRNHLSPPLPKTYFGNATFPTVTPTCSFDDIIHMPLSYAVGKVREAIGKMSDEYVRSALDYIANLDDMNLFRDMFYDNSAGKGDPNLFVVAWTNFLFYDSDFGWGEPVCMLPGNINSDGKAFLLDSASGDGFIVAICLQASHVDAFKKLFYDDIEKPSSKL